MKQPSKKKNNPDPIIHDLEVMSHATNYREWIYGHLSKHIGQRIAELGAGIGNCQHFSYYMVALIELSGTIEDILKMNLKKTPYCWLFDKGYFLYELNSCDWLVFE